jgi:pimeloyl-ACP methyl ester carboxylesterase
MADQFKTGTVRANGIDFGFIEAGDGPLVLLLHGFPDNAYTFRNQLPVLEEAGYRAVAPFLRGYSPTTVAEGSYQTTVLCRDVLALIDGLGSENAAVFGHDWGAVLAMGAAELAPGKINRLIAASVPHVGPLFGSLVTNAEQQRRSWYIYFFQLPIAVAAVPANDFAFLDRLWQDWSPGWDYPAEVMQSVKATMAHPGVLNAALAYYRCLFDSSSFDPQLADIQATLFSTPILVPTLYFHGENDGCIGVELVEGMDSFFAGGLEKAILPVGHFIHQEAPDEVNRRLLSFL